MMHLQIVIVSTREQRQGPAVARWFQTQAEKHAGFELELIDLAEVNLPLLDEPHHPRLANYVHEHTKRWSGLSAAPMRSCSSPLRTITARRRRW